MAPVRDLLALILGSTLAAVWAVYMVAQVARGQAPAETDWAILPAGAAAIMTAVYVRPETYRGRHKGG